MPRRRPPAAVLLLAALGAGGCSPRFEPEYRVTDLRILAIRAEAEGTAVADPSPGQTLVLRALVANPRARPGAAVSWYACAPTPSEALGPCADLALLADPTRLTGDPRVALLGACTPDATGECAIAAPLPDVTAALEYRLALAARDPAFSCRPYVEWPVVAVASAAGRQVIALKRVRVVPTAADLAARGLSAAYAPNLNPELVDVVRDRPRWGSCTGGLPVAPAPFPARETVLCATAGAGTAEKYTACGPAGEHVPATETARFQWFVTAGSFPDYESGSGNADRNEPRFDRARSPFTLWAIVRDGRGGEAWVRREVAALP